MMAGVPAVVSDVGDLADLVEHGVNGFLVRERCPRAFAACILQLLGDEQSWRRFSAAARSSAERFDLAAGARRWDGILTQL